MRAERDALRLELRARRRALPAAVRMAAAEALAARLLALPVAAEPGLVAGYWAMDGEIALHAWQLRLPAHHVYCLPLLHEDGRLRFAPWRPGEALVANRHGIPEPDVPRSSWIEPESLTAAVVPLVGFDRHGHRLGMGGGWYDRTFAFRREHTAPPWLVGAAFATQEVERLAAAAWDVALDAVCSERDTLLFADRPPDPMPA